MPRDDDWNDDDRPRQRRDRDDFDYEDDYIDRRLRRAEHSGAVTAVGVINIIIGALAVLLGLCLLLGGAVAGGAAHDFRGNPGGGLFAALAGVILIVAFLVLAMAVLQIVAGVGVLNRRSWARILTLVLGGISALFGLLGIFGMISALANPAGDDRAAGVLGSLIGAFLYIGYSVLVFVILLNPQYAEEFH